MFDISQQVDADEIALEIGLVPDEELTELEDASGVRYTGAPAELALAAMLRPDLTPNLSLAVREIAETVAAWITCPARGQRHWELVTKIRAMPAYRMCELVAHLVNTGDPSSFYRVGPQALPHYLRYIAEFPDNDGPMPRMLDDEPGDVRSSNRSLRVTASTGDGRDHVRVAITLTVQDGLTWRRTVPVSLPVYRMHEFGTDSAALMRYLELNRTEWEPNFTLANATRVGKVIGEAELAASPFTEHDPSDLGGHVVDRWR